MAEGLKGPGAEGERVLKPSMQDAFQVKDSIAGSQVPIVSDYIRNKIGLPQMTDKQLVQVRQKAGEILERAGERMGITGKATADQQSADRLVTKEDIFGKTTDPDFNQFMADLRAKRNQPGQQPSSSPQQPKK